MKENTFKTLQKRDLLPVPDHRDWADGSIPGDVDGYPHFWSVLLVISEVLASRTSLDRSQIKELIGADNNLINTFCGYADASEAKGALIEEALVLALVQFSDGPRVLLVTTEEMHNLFEELRLQTGAVTGLHFLRVVHELSELHRRLVAWQKGRVIPEFKEEAALTPEEREELKAYRRKLDEAGGRVTGKSLRTREEANG